MGQGCRPPLFPSFLALSRVAYNSRMRNALSTYHPALTFFLLLGAIVLTMVVRHPLYLAATLLLSIACYTSLQGARSLARFAWMLPLLVLVVFGNPLVNTLGSTVLFTYFGGRPYTLEALYYGIAIGVMVASMFFWFASFNELCSTDRISYLFRHIAPAASLVVTMVLRLVPNFQTKLKAFTQARACIGMSGETGSLKERAAAGSTLLSKLAAWALEASQQTADSMQSRGYGLSGRTSYARYSFTRRDAAVGLVAALLFVGVVAGLANGAASVEYIPELVLPPLSGGNVAGVACFAAFLALPAVLNYTERVRWHISLSKI